jgi:S1-C subfamily serine protease
MDSAPPPEASADEYFVMQRGEFIGPVTLEELRFGLEHGRFGWRDLVQRGRTPVWHRAEKMIAAGAAELGPATAPGWGEIFAAARGRLQRDVRTASVKTAGVFLAAGIAAWLLSRWPVALWLPWFLPPVIAGVMALTRGRLRRGMVLLFSVAVVPVLATALRPRNPTPAEPARTAPALPQARSIQTPLPAQPSLPPPTAAVATTPAPPPAAETVTGQVRQLPALPPEPPAALKSKPKPASAPPAAPGDLVQTHRDCFVLVTGDEGHGSGFICRLGGRTLLFTNNHVVAGMRQPRFSQLSGAQVSVGAAESAAGCDLMRLALPAPPAHPLEAMTDLEANARIGDEVVVLGNTGGGGVVTSLGGDLLGIGPDRVEVSAEFIPGNSGSPIVHVKTGRVIGIATYLTRRYEEVAGQARGPRSGEMVVRRFGYRLDTAKKWEPVNWAAFQAEAEQLRKISQLTGDVFDFLAALREGHAPQFATDTLRRPAMEWVGKTARTGVSEADRRSATQGFLGALRLMVRADVTAAETGLRYTFFRDELRQEREIRDRLYKAFDDEVRRMASPSGRAGF